MRLSRRFVAAKMGENDDLEEFITKMTALAQELRELNDPISSQKFATVMLGSLPDSYDAFLTSFNTRPIEELKWENVKCLLKEEYLKRKEKENSSSSSSHMYDDEALFTRDLMGNASRGFHGGRGGRGGRNGGRGGYQTGGVTRNHPYNNNNNNNYNNFNNNNTTKRGGVENFWQNQPRRGGSFRGTCFRCEEFGHRANVCPLKHNSEQVNFVAAGNEFKTEFFHEDDSFNCF